MPNYHFFSSCGIKNGISLFTSKMMRNISTTCCLRAVRRTISQQSDWRKFNALRNMSTAQRHAGKDQEHWSKAKYIKLLIAAGGTLELMRWQYPDIYSNAVDSFGIITAYMEELKRDFLQKVEDRFEVGQILGEGGFAVVYKALDKRNKNLPVALKVMPRDSPDIAKVVEDEVGMMQAVGVHDNIVSLHCTVETPKHWLLVLDLADGGALFDRIVDHRQRGIELALADEVELRVRRYEVERFPQHDGASDHEFGRPAPAHPGLRRYRECCLR